MMETNNILQHIYKKSSLEEVPISALEQLVQKHPYFAAGHFFLSQKLKQQGDGEKQLLKTNLYFHNVLWVHHLLNTPSENTEPITSTDQPVSFLKSFVLDDATPTTAPDYSEYGEDDEYGDPDDTDEPMTFQIPVPADLVLDMNQKPPETEELAFDPYHTIDYFASLGIRLNQDPKADDKLGLQLKSFTAWLKTMRRLPDNPEEHIVEVNQADLNAHIEKIAANSLLDQEVLTQAMAEVLEMQGNKDKAAIIYRKLSLINPDKSAYFAAKIEELKQP